MIRRRGQRLRWRWCRWHDESSNIGSIDADQSGASGDSGRHESGGLAIRKGADESDGLVSQQSPMSLGGPASRQSLMSLTRPVSRLAPTLSCLVSWHAPLTLAALPPNSSAAMSPLRARSPLELMRLQHGQVRLHMNLLTGGVCRQRRGTGAAESERARMRIQLAALTFA